MKQVAFYERKMLFKKLYYPLYWFFVGTFFFLTQELLLRFTHEYSYLVTRLLIIYGGCTIFPIICIYISHSFQQAFYGLNDVINVTADDFRVWSESVFRKLFTYDTWLMKIVILIITIVVYSSLLAVNFPYQKTSSNAILFISFLPFVIVGSHGAYAVIAAIYFLIQLPRKFTIKVPFYFQKHPKVYELANFYYSASFLVLFVYIYIAIAFWYSSYGFSQFSITWVAILGFFPLAMFLVTFQMIHILLRSIKQEHLMVCNRIIQESLIDLEEEVTKDNIERIKLLMGIQDDVEKLSEWPINLESIFTFTITLAIPLINILLK